MVKIYGMAQSGNCYKLQLLLSFLQQKYEWQDIDILSGETQTPEFLKRNPAGKVPLLEIESNTFLPESNAALFYLANESTFWPSDPLQQANVLRWMFFEQYSHEPYIAVARFIKRFLPKDHPRHSELPELHQKGSTALKLMNQHLADNVWFVGDTISIADIALFAYTHVAAEGGFELSQYLNIKNWISQVQQQPHYTPMVL
ncbi:MAG: glutathione S-transferase family protein [Gammaproteobacteria bacterium]|nr:glutathione S-transferase family protein [Gammaproteobacteria bacterium]